MGRPKKHGESTETLTVRVPKSIANYLREKDRSVGAAAWSVLQFEHALTRELEPMLEQLRIYAAHHGQSYDLERAETLAALVRLGLEKQKK